MKKSLQLRTLFGILAFVFMGMLNMAKAQNVYVQDASGPNVCDGYAIILDSTAVASSAVWQYGGAVAQTGTLSIGNLCPGTYVVVYAVASPAGGTTNVTYTFTITGNSVNPCAGFYGNVSYTDETAMGACDGTAMVAMVGGTAPYTYAWSNGSTTPAQNNLCSGYYLCYISDANGCNTADSVYIATGTVVNDSMLVINNTPYPGVPVVGYVMASVEDCLLNFNAVDSVSITGLNYLGSSGTFNAYDSVQVTWSVWDTTGAVLATYTVNYTLPNPVQGVYSFGLYVYCTQKSMDYTSMMVTDQYNYTPLAITEIEQFNGKVINPFNEVLTIAMNEMQTGSMTLMSAQGQVVKQVDVTNEAEVTISTIDLAAGTYFLQLNLNSGVSVLKVMKK